VIDRNTIKKDQNDSVSIDLLFVTSCIRTSTNGGLCKLWSLVRCLLLNYFYFIFIFVN
jgi:hypothetical protein